MKHDITFIHTAKIHINTFNALLNELAPKLNVHHVVDESLLAYAQQHSVDAILEAKVAKQIEELSVNSKVIVITCSSIGAIAENISSINGCVILRVDRAMADFAVINGKNILVVAALESTLEPTNELLKSSIQNTHTSPKVTFKCLNNAWDYFLSGNMEGYFKEIATALKLNEAQYDLIVLAQASMAGVVDQVDLSIPIISSPKLGAQCAIDALTI